MRIKYFEDTDTLHVELKESTVEQTQELNENLYVDLDADGKVVSFTVEHVRATSGKLDFSYETVVA